MHKSMSEFYGVLDNLSVVNQNLQKHREELQKYVNELQNNVQKIQMDQDLRKRNTDIAKNFDEILFITNASIESWKAEFDKNLKSEELRAELANSFIVMVFGRVKAGKSFLGNFIATHSQSSKKAEFFMYDADKKELIHTKNGFETNILECTNVIQGFKLSALAWIDTPGLGSVTKENGDLAKEYFGSADYIIYPSSSTSPLQMDEIDELREIIAKAKKEVSIIITKSDVTEEDEIDEKVVQITKNKTQDVRREQEDECKSRIIEQFGDDASKFNKEIFSLSTLMANNGLKENDKNKFNKSGIIKFYETLSDIVQNKASAIKSSVPTKELQKIADKILRDNNIKNKVAEFKDKIIENKNRLSILKSNCENDVKSIVISVINEYVKNIDKSNLNYKFKKVDLKIQDLINKMISKNINEVIKDFNSSLIKFSDSLKTDYEITDKIHKITTSTKTRNGTIGGAFLGGLATIGAALLTGGASLPLQIVTSLAAGAAGSYMGNKIGQETGEDNSENIVIGDNKEEIISDFQLNRSEYYIKKVSQIYEFYTNDFFTQLENLVQNIENEFNKFNEKVEKFNRSLK